MESVKGEGSSGNERVLHEETAPTYPQSAFQEDSSSYFGAGMMPAHQQGALQHAESASPPSHQIASGSSTHPPLSTLAPTSGSAKPASSLSEGNPARQSPRFVRQQHERNWGATTSSELVQDSQQHPLHLIPAVSAQEELGVSQSSGGPGTLAPGPAAIKLLVSNNVAGSIIGRFGQTISELQSQSSARIKLSQTGDFYPGTQDRVCLVQGQLDTVKLAVRLLLERFYCLQQQQQHAHQSTWQLKENEEQQTNYGGFDFVVRVLVPSSSCGMIIGKSGSNIKRMEEVSGVSSVRLSAKDSPDSSSPTSAGVASTSERIVTLTGPTFDSCLICLHMILNGMMINTETSRYANMTTSYSRGTLHGSFALMPNVGSAPDGSLLAVPIVSAPESPMWETGSQYTNQFAVWKRSNSSPDLGAHIMWDQQQGLLRSQSENPPGPMSIRHPQPREPVQQHYNAILPDETGLFPSDVPPMVPAGRGGMLSVPSPPMYLVPPNQPSHLDSNSIPNSLSAPDLIAIQFQEALRLEASPSPGAPEYPHFVPQIPQPTPPGFSAQVQVPDSLLGSILGRGGRTLNELQMHSGTRIRISQRGEFVPGTRNRIVTVRGPTAQSVSLAQYLMNQRIVLPPTSSYTGHPTFHPSQVLQEQDYRHQQEHPSQQRNDLQTADFPNPYVDSSTFPVSESQTG